MNNSIKLSANILYTALLLCAIFLNTRSAFAQQSRTTALLKITIIDENDVPIEATINIKGTQNTFYTNAKGEFILSPVFNNSTLVISGINIETFEKKLDHDGKDFTIRVKRIIADMEEVVVANTGYQQVKPNEMNGSLVLIDNKTLNQQTGTNILKRLDGVTSGLSFNFGKANKNPQNTTNISIRGLSTINGPLDPLIVMDGFIYEGDINNINPNDVENITVLKDASAASIWGARAGNGVIVITTKKGRFNQKLTVTANAVFSVSDKPDLFTIPQVSSGDYIDIETFLFNKGYFNSRINSPYLPLTPAVEVLLKRRKGLISAADSAEQIDGLKSFDVRNDYEKYVYRKAQTNQYAVNMQGGSTMNNYNFSVGYDKTTGTLRDEKDKLNIRINNSFRPLKQLTINVGAYYTNSKAYTGTLGYQNTVSVPGGRAAVPYYRLVNADGAANSIANLYRNSFTDTAGAGKLLPWKYYPLTEYQHAKSINDLQELYSNLGIQYRVFSFLNIELQYQYQKQVTGNDRLADPESFEARNLINLYSQLNRNTGIVNYNIPNGGILTTTNSTVQSQTLRGQLNFSKAWRNHSINGLTGAETREAKSFGDSYAAYGYNPDPLTNTAVDYINNYPLWTGGSNTIPGAPAFTNTVYRFVSLYGNAAYSYKSIYSLSGSFRNDGSNIFGVSTNDKWNPLWSAGAGWKISGEPFYHFSQLPLLKLRATYGASGNVDLSRSALAVARYSSSSSVPFPYGRISTLNNADLKWEKAIQWNLAIDFAIKKERLKGTIELYRKKGTDLYGQTPYDYTTWGASDQIIKNVADMKGKGIDISLEAKILDGNFKWNAGFLYNFNNSKTTRYFSVNAVNPENMLGGGNTIIPVVGMPLYGIVAYKWGGLDSLGNPQGYVDGKKSIDYNAISEEAMVKGLGNGNLVFKGSGSPTSFGSLINSFSWKEFSISINISYRFNYYFLKPSLSYNTVINSGGMNAEYKDRWQKAGDELLTSVPAFIYPNSSVRDNFYQLSEINVLKADNIKLNYINLAYSFEKNKNKWLPFQYLQLYVNATNLGYLWKANSAGIDPDAPRSYQAVKTFSLGLRTNF